MHYLKLTTNFPCLIFTRDGLNLLSMMILVDLISVTSIIDISQVPFGRDIKIKECLIMIGRKINSTLQVRILKRYHYI